VTDSKGGEKVGQIEITDFRMKVSALQTREVSAPGAADGQARVEVQGGVPPFRYQWDNGESASEAAQLSAGLHQVTVTAPDGCSATATVNISQALAELSASISIDQEVKCSGGAEASLHVAVSGGQAPYLYQWSAPGISGDQPQNLPAGNYTLTVSDAAGNTTLAQIAIAEPAKLTAEAIATSPASTGQADGQARASAAGGTPPYAFAWDNGQSAADASALAPGTRSVTVTDAAGCTAVASVDISEDILPLALRLSQSAEIACQGGSGAALAAEVTGGKAPFAYQWSQAGLSGAQAQGLAAGEYQLTVTDASGQQQSAAIAIAEPAKLTAEAIATSPASTGQADGQARASAAGGTPPYAFAWDNGQSAADASALAPGTRSVTVTDAAGCTAVASVDISEDILPLALRLSQSAEIACQGGSGAALAAEVTGGKAPFAYQWSQAGLSGAQAQGLAAGEYQLTVTDASGQQQSAAIAIAEPAKLTAEAIATSPASTGQADGQARASAAGGTPPYAFAWDNGQSAADASALAPGTRSVTVTDAAGCTAVASVDISEDILPLAVRLSQSAEIACQGGSGAALAAEVTGGKGPFAYQWSQAGLSGAQAQGLAAGEYQLTVTDASGQQQSAAIAIAEPAKLTAEAVATSPASTGQADGQARASAAGGTPPYAFAWDNGQSAADASALAPGTRSVTVTDAAGCTAVASVDISEDILPLALRLSQSAEIACQGGSGAALAAEVTGGKAPFAYQWSQAGLSGAQAQGLAAGEYQLTVTDASGQQQSAAIAIAEPAKLTAEAIATSPASTGQADGQARASAAGGTPPYAFAWDNGQSAADASALAPGTRSVTVTDAAGCTAVASVDISEDILPLALRLSQSAEIACQGGSGAALAAEVTGGKAPFAYQWSQAGLSGAQAQGLAAGEYQLTVTDASGQQQSAAIAIAEPATLTAEAIATSPASTGQADGQARASAAGGTPPYAFAWDNGQSAADASALAPGTRSVTVTDAAGCTAVASVDISEDILPLALRLSQSAEIACQGGSGAALAAEVTGGKAPFAYQWSQAGLSGAQAQGLAAGEYQLTVTDASGQQQSAAIAIAEPAKLTAEAIATSPASTGQADGQARASAAGGTPPYAFAWDNGQSAADASALAPGTRSVTVTDAAGCTAVASVDISEDILPLALRLSQSAEIACQGGSGAALAAEVTGGKAPFAYQWSQAGLSGAQAQGLAAGEYQLTVTDASGQQQSAAIAIAEPAKLTAEAIATSPASTGQADGQARASAAGGTPPYAFAWDNGQSAADASALAPGTRSVTVTDAAGCTAVASVDISEDILPLALRLSQSAEIACQGGSGAALAAEVTGGKAPFAYQWSQAGLSGAQAQGLAAGEYQLTVTDASGQQQSAAIAIAEPAKLTAEAIATSPASTGQADGQARASAAGGTPPYAFAWDNGQSAADASALAPGTRSVTVTDAAGCTAVASVDISEDILPLTAAISLQQEISCAGAADAAIALEVNGGKGPFQYEWNVEALTGTQATGLGPGEYEVTVTDGQGTTQTARLAIIEPTPLAAEITSTLPAFSETTTDGKASARAQGGRPPYNFAWSNGAAGPDAEGFAIGNYQLTVTDSRGCQTSVDFEITERIMKELAGGALRSGQTIQMQKLQFDADSTNLRPDALPILDEIFVFLRDNPTIAVEIGGHTNNLPPAEYCDMLSTARARAVAEYLVQKGIDPERVYYQGYGKRNPLFSNATEDGRRRNQRVEIKILRL
jgi:outer membrane protein OmpA-like peptidoglycan-associated protein